MAQGRAALAHWCLGCCVHACVWLCPTHSLPASLPCTRTPRATRGHPHPCRPVAALCPCWSSPTVRWPPLAAQAAPSASRDCMLARRAWGSGGGCILLFQALGQWSPPVCGSVAEAGAGVWWQLTPSPAGAPPCAWRGPGGRAFSAHLPGRHTQMVGTDFRWSGVWQTLDHSPWPLG